MSDDLQKFFEKAASPKDVPHDKVDDREKAQAELKRLLLLWVACGDGWVGCRAGSSEKVDGHPACWNGMADDPLELFEKGACRRDGLSPRDDGKASPDRSDLAEGHGMHPGHREHPI
jgi:hypothetical protein